MRIPVKPSGDTDGLHRNSGRNRIGMPAGFTPEWRTVWVGIRTEIMFLSFFRSIHPPESLIFQGHSPTPFSRAFTHLG